MKMINLNGWLFEGMLKSKIESKSERITDVVHQMIVYEMPIEQIAKTIGLSIEK